MILRPFPCRSVLLAFCICVAAVGCARQPYRPRPLDASAAAAAYAAHSPDDAGLKQYMVAHGHPDAQWPVAEWGLSELTLLALYYRPELKVARAEAGAARADAVAAAPRGPVRVTPYVWHHSAPGAQDTPWSLGFDLEIPLASGSQSRALTDRAEYLAQAAELNVGTAAWQVRSQVRARLVDLYAASERARTAQAELEQQQAALGLLERRLAAGYASVTEVDTMRLRVAESEGALSAARTDTALATGRLAEALAVPLDHVARMKLSYAALDALPTSPAAAAARADALTNRIDIRTRLLDFEAADAAVRLEVARQYPTVTLRPGYLWDQGDNVWAIAVDLFLPSKMTYGPAIASAEAHREVAAQQALALQAAVIAEVGTRLTTYTQAVEGARAGAAASRMQLARSSQTQRQFDVGQADRLELTLARIEALAVQRRALDARIEAQRALGLLEDALQLPLAGAPLPRWADAPGAAEAAGPSR